MATPFALGADTDDVKLGIAAGDDLLSHAGGRSLHHDATYPHTHKHTCEHCTRLPTVSIPRLSSFDSMRSGHLRWPNRSPCGLPDALLPYSTIEGRPRSDMQKTQRPVAMERVVERTGRPLLTGGIAVGRAACLVGAEYGNAAQRLNSVDLPHEHLRAFR